MLVPSMTLEEVRKEFEKDFGIIYRKSKYVAEKDRKTITPQGPSAQITWAVASVPDR